MAAAGCPAPRQPLGCGWEALFPGPSFPLPSLSSRRLPPPAPHSHGATRTSLITRLCSETPRTKQFLTKAAWPCEGWGCVPLRNLTIQESPSEAGSQGRDGIAHRPRALTRAQESPHAHWMLLCSRNSPDYKPRHLSPIRRSNVQCFALRKAQC